MLAPSSLKHSFKEHLAHHLPLDFLALLATAALFLLLTPHFSDLLTLEGPKSRSSDFHNASIHILMVSAIIVVLDNIFRLMISKFIPLVGLCSPNTCIGPSWQLSDAPWEGARGIIISLPIANLISPCRYAIDISNEHIPKQTPHHITPTLLCSSCNFLHLTSLRLHPSCCSSQKLWSRLSLFSVSCHQESLSVLLSNNILSLTSSCSLCLLPPWSKLPSSLTWFTTRSFLTAVPASIHLVSPLFLMARILSKNQILLCSESSNGFVL